jgi:hypothetical protein
VQKNEKNSVGLLELETAVLECFLEKTPLSPLGINNLDSTSLFIYLSYPSSGFVMENVSSFCFSIQKFPSNLILFVAGEFYLG